MIMSKDEFIKMLQQAKEEEYRRLYVLGEYIGILETENAELKKENQQLKECYCNRIDCSGRIKNSRNYDSLYQKYNKQKEAIDKVNLIIKGIAYGGSEDYYIEKINEIHRLLKEVSE